MNKSYSKEERLERIEEVLLEVSQSVYSNMLQIRLSQQFEFDLVKLEKM